MASCCFALRCCLATVLDNLWEPVGTLEWQDQAGVIHRISQSNAEEEVLSAFARDAKAVSMTKASERYLGEGAEHGVDFLGFR